jgi:Tol biopolymer transport system component
MRRLVVAACLIATMLPTLAASDQRARVLMQAAEAKVTVEGDLVAAIKLYKDAEKEAGANRALIAQVLVKMADAYRTLGDAKAQRIYRRIVDEFGDQQAAAQVARLHLAPNKPAPAGAMLRDVADLDASGSVSADGRYATYVNWDTGNIALRDLVAGTSRELTARNDYFVYSPVISRDGQFIAYEAFNRCGQGMATRHSASALLCVLAVAGEPAATANTIFGGEDVREIVPMDWSPDRTALAVVLKRDDGTAQVGIVQVRGPALKVLQSTDWRGTTRAVFSPDGRYIAFDVASTDDGDHREIRVLAVDGSQGTTAVQHPSHNTVMGWTPDGGYLLFASDRAGSVGLWAQRMIAGKPAPGSSRLVHPGIGGALYLGMTIEGALYFGLQSGDRDIEIVTLDLSAATAKGAPVRPALAYVGTNMMPEWSSDGNYLAYVSQRGVAGNIGRIIGIRDSSTGVVRELRPKLTYMEKLAWAPDDATLITDGTDLRGRAGVFTIDVRTGDVAFVTKGRFPRYSPDGRRIYYVSPGEQPPNSIVERDVASGAERTVINGDFATFTLSPDGRSLAIARGHGAPGAREIVSVSAATGDATTLYRAQPGEGLPTHIGLPWTPDGRAILMRTYRSRQELWLLPIAGDSPRKIDIDMKAWAPGPVGTISLHPDGRQLVYTQLREDHGPEVRVLTNFLSALK